MDSKWNRWAKFWLILGVHEPVKVTDDVKKRKQKSQENIWPSDNNQTPARANETEKKNHRFLHRGKS